MRTKEYLEKVTEGVDQTVGKDYSWRFNDYGNNVVEASAKIDTVAGRKTMIVHCDGEKIFPCIIIADEGDIEDFPEEESDTLFNLINTVNYTYNNIAVAFITEACDNLFLRGIVYLTFQDELNSRNYSDETVYLQAVGSIVDFINAVNNDYGTDALCDLFDMF